MSEASGASARLRALFAYRGKSSGRADLSLGVVAFALFLGLWSFISVFEIVPQRFLPLPWEVVKALWRPPGTTMLKPRPPRRLCFL